MTSPQRDYAWLPEHQFHVAYTLAHVDALIARAGEVLHDYLKPPGPLELENVQDEQWDHVTVVGVKPLPPAVARYAADAMTQLRAAIEHTIYAEVEHELGRELQASEAQRVGMPATITEKAFTDWLKERRRDELPPLRDGSPLVHRLRVLQPYQRQDVDNHPMRVLAEHTNLAKHRTPAVAATLLGTVRADVHEPALLTATGGDGPIRPGDILATGPRYKPVPLSIWPKVSIQRAHTRTWHVAMRELGELEDWVRTVAIPHLVAGTRDVSPLPPQLDTTVGYGDVRAALFSAGQMPAFERANKRIVAGTARQDLVETLALAPQRVSPDAIQDWADALNDDLVLEKMGRLVAAGTPRRLESVVREFLAEASRSGGHDPQGQ